jgi:hypothetical protein
MASGNSLTEQNLTRRIITIAVIVFLAILIVGFVPYWFFCQLSDAGSFGDSFGMVNAIVSGLVFVFLIYEMRLQRIDLKLQKKAIDAQLDEMKDSKKQLKEQVRTSFLTAYLNSLGVTIEMHGHQIKNVTGNGPRNYINRIMRKQRQNPLRHEAEELVKRLRPYAEGYMGVMKPRPSAALFQAYNALNSLEMVANKLSEFIERDPEMMFEVKFPNMIQETYEEISQLHDLCEHGPHADLYKDGTTDRIAGVLSDLEWVKNTYHQHLKKDGLESIRDTLNRKRSILQEHMDNLVT